MCNRPTCRFVHLLESDKVEIVDQRVAVCRDHAKGACKRQQCKYYHIPIILPPANIMATINKTTNINRNDFITTTIPGVLTTQKITISSTIISPSPTTVSTKLTECI